MILTPWDGSKSSAADRAASAEFDGWYRMHGQAIYRFIMRRVGSAEDARDILQSTYLGAWENRALYRGTAQPKTWLTAIALSVLRNHVMRAYDARVVVVSIDDHEEELIDTRAPERCIAVKQSFSKLVDFAQSLPAEQQRMLELLFIDNGSYVEVAAALGIPVGTVRSRLSRLRARLDKYIETGGAV
ncbi:RNA polymerase sigma factor [Trinickia fusca]|uniref:Sigma-70 family RNA polymerase sigma factor n=1 Tax=Trinickia fusca TaxID=2419777 RepID=A0A494XNJ2_9BURK|nr:sigma-70 family RNA polymerase sigma factor [Trinickia fusca]RKP52188.1 sigma-70 family RNA polymerase sigma factor [Trinickia fusca]